MSKQQVLKSESKCSFKKLEEFNISHDLIIEVVETGIRFYKSSTSFHSKTHAGSIAWHEMVAVLRKGLAQDGWCVMDRNGLPLIYNKKLNVSIAVSSGNKETGITDKKPSSKNPKGIETQSLIGQNMDLFSDLNSANTNHPVDSYKTYIFLYYFDLAMQEARFELSQPIDISTKGYISDWSERQHFAPISFNDEIDFDLEHSDDNKDIDFDIDFKVNENA